MEIKKYVETDKRLGISEIIKAHNYNLFFQQQLQEAAYINSKKNPLHHPILKSGSNIFQIPNILGNKIIEINNLAVFYTGQIKDFILASDKDSILTSSPFSLNDLDMAHLTLLIDFTGAVNMKNYFIRMSQMLEFEGDYYHVPANRIPVASDYTQTLIELAKHLGYDISQLIKSS